MDVLNWILDHWTAFAAVAALLWAFALTANRFLKKEYRITKNLGVPVYFVSHSHQDVAILIERLTEKGGMLSSKQVKSLRPDDLDMIKNGRCLVIVCCNQVKDAGPVGQPPTEAKTGCSKSRRRTSVQQNGANTTKSEVTPQFLSIDLVKKVQDDKATCMSIPVLVYAPDGRFDNEDMKYLSKKQVAISQFPLRLASDIWAAMCTLPMHKKNTD